MEFDKFAKESMDYFNELTQRKLGLTQTRTKLLKRIYKEKYTIEQVRFVVKNKYLEWSTDSKMAKYIRPETLFRFSNFETYVDELPIKDNSGQTIVSETQQEIDRYKQMFKKRGD